MSLQLADNARVRRRTVFFIGGYDPRGPAFHYGLYSEHAPRQGRISGTAFDVGPRRNQGHLVSRWAVAAEHDGERVETDYWLLRWDDLVRARWKQKTTVQMVDIFRRITAFARAGLYPILIGQAKPVLAAGFFPVAALALYTLVVTAAVAGLSAGAFHLAKPGVWAWALTVLPWLALAAAFFAGWRWLDRQLALSWLNRCFGSLQDSARDPSADEARCDTFARMIDEAVTADPPDEVMIIGHSLGALHAVRTTARLLALDETLGRGPTRLSLLTLGQTFAVYTPLSDDRNFRRDLAKVAASDRLAWLDETSPADPVSSCGLDPLNGLEVPGRLWPVRRSPRFHLLVSPAAYRRLKLSPFDFHFQYLKSGEIAGDYDFFRITAGPDLLLAEARP